MLDGVPSAHLHVAGEGDHREAFEAEIAARGLAGRVTLHGFVDEATKRELLASAWVSLTASSAEGWCLTVMEAGACRTPSAALRVGGLAESIVDGETGVLADDPGRARRARARAGRATPPSASAWASPPSAARAPSRGSARRRRRSTSSSVRERRRLRSALRSLGRRPGRASPPRR